MTNNLKDIYTYFKERHAKIDVILGFLEEELQNMPESKNQDSITSVINGSDGYQPFMTKRAIESLFLKQPRWSLGDMVKEFEKMGRDVSYNTVANHLSYLARQGRLSRVGSGLYELCPDSGFNAEEQDNDNT